MPAAERRAFRRTAIGALLAAVLVPYTIMLATLWSTTRDELDAARRERAGVTALRPLVTVLAATADAQTRAVWGEAPDPGPLRAAVSAMDAADAAVGRQLGTDRRWADLRSRLGQLASSTTRSTAAYTLFSQVIDLELALTSAVVDSSGLAVDPALESHYLVDAAGARIPAMIVIAGRISDLTYLLEQGVAPVAPDTLAAAVAQAELRSASDQLVGGIRKGFEGSGAASLGPELVSQLDRLSDAVTNLTPPMSSVGSAPVRRPAVATQDARQRLRGATLATSTAALDQLTDLLDDRVDATSGTRRLVVLATAAGLLVALAVAWVAGPRRRTLDDVPAPDRGDGSGAGGGAGAGAGDGVSDQLLDARDLLEARQLLRVGRAVSAPRPDDDAPAEEGP